MSEINPCAPIYDMLQDNSLNLRVTRILLGVILLVLYLLFNLISFYLRRNINNLQQQDKQSNQRHLEHLQFTYKKWQQQYLLSFGDFSVSIGFVMCFCPYQLELIISLSYLILRIFYQVKLHKFQSQTRTCKTIFRIINMSLLICTMIGISRTGLNDITGQCFDSIYQLV